MLRLRSIHSILSAARTFPLRVKVLITRCGGCLRRTDCRFCKNGAKTFAGNSVSHDSQPAPYTAGIFRLSRSLRFPERRVRLCLSKYYPIRSLRGCAAFACSCEDGRPDNPVPSHSLSDTSFLHTDIGRTRSDWFSSAAPRLIAPPFFNTSFFIFGERKSRQEFEGSNPYFRRAQRPAGGSLFFRHLFTLIFHKIKIFSRNGRGNIRPFPSVRSSHCKHGLSVRMSQSLLTFSGGVRPAVVCGNRDVRPSLFTALRAIFHNTLDWTGRIPERLQERFRRSAHFYAYRYENRI